MPTTPALDISVVIPTYNRPDFVPGLLQSLVEQTMSPRRFEVVVVDDGGERRPDAAVERFAQEHPAHRLRYHRIQHGGLNVARNTGIDVSTGAAVCFLDDDELVPPGFLDLAVDLLSSNPGVAGVGGPQLDYGDSGFHTCATCTIGEVRLAADARGLTQRLLGGNMTLRRSAFDEVGPFDPAISGRGDETEWFQRSGREYLYDEDLFVWHRREELTLRDLCRVQIRQGRAIPVSYRKMRGRPWRPSLVRPARYLAHAARRRCDKGYLLASRELGATLEWAKLQLSTRRRAGNTVR